MKSSLHGEKEKDAPVSMIIGLESVSNEEKNSSLSKLSLPE